MGHNGRFSSPSVSIPHRSATTTAVTSQSKKGARPQLQAEYIYDGAGNRVQQVDHTGAAPLTITYTNDVAGLTQVLVADDGAEQVYNLFGLDLIGQDEGSQTRYLLADGLGSVRIEMAEDDVESVTTYGPYGNLLAQTGGKSTAYGYTGEQHDASTGLLYLRARYYNPSLRSFIGGIRGVGMSHYRNPRMVTVMFMVILAH